MISALPVFVPPLAAAIAAILAAGIAWAAATPLVRAAGSPTLPERLPHWAGQHRFIAILAYLPAVFTGRQAAWLLPLAWLGLQITTHRVRRRIFGDTWSFAGQVWWNARAFLAMWTWWWTLMFFPAVLVEFDAGPGLAIVVGVALLLWLYFYNDVLGAVLRARRIDAHDGGITGRDFLSQHRHHRDGGGICSEFALAQQPDARARHCAGDFQRQHQHAV